MDSIRSAAEATAASLAGDPDAGPEPDAAAVAVLEDGLRFRVDGPKGSVPTDMARSVGGAETANSPGWLSRAALAACDASLIAIEAAREGIELAALKVTVDGESDFRGLLGVGDYVPAGPVSLRTRIEIEAPGADAERVRAIVERALRRSPVKDAFERAVAMTTEVVVR